ncbi:putative glycerol-3-phosphate dehydrogenase (gpdh), partial [Toxoplasma gondii GT1]
MEVNHFILSACERWETSAFDPCADTRISLAVSGEEDQHCSERREHHWASGHQFLTLRHSYAPPLWNLFAVARHSPSPIATVECDNFILSKKCSLPTPSVNSSEDKPAGCRTSPEKTGHGTKSDSSFSCAAYSAPVLSFSPPLPFWLCAAKISGFPSRRTEADTLQPTLDPVQQCRSEGSTTKSRGSSLSPVPGSWCSGSAALGNSLTRSFSATRQNPFRGPLRQSSVSPACAAPLKLGTPRLSAVTSRARRNSVDPTRPSTTSLRALSPHTSVGSDSLPTRLVQTFPSVLALVHKHLTWSAFLRFLADGKVSGATTASVFRPAKPQVLYRFRGFDRGRSLSTSTLSAAAPRSLALFFLLFFLTGLPSQLRPSTQRTLVSASSFLHQPIVPAVASAVQASAFVSPRAVTSPVTRSSAWSGRRNTRAFSSSSVRYFHTKRKRTNDHTGGAMESFLRPIQPKRSLFQVLQKGPLRVAVIGSGNWGSVIGKICAQNAERSYVFHDQVRMWVFEEMIEGQKLTDIINQKHENVKYLPGHKLPDNLVAVPDVVEACRGADLLVFVMPHQFVAKVCDQLAKANVVPSHARAISLLKGLYVEGGRPQLFSDTIRSKLNIVECAALSGANVANDVAREEFAEATIGHSPDETDTALIWQQLFDKPYFKVNTLPDVAGVQLCGAVKNVVALAAGFCDGLGLGTNTKSAIIRLGVEEMKQFGMIFFDNVIAETFFDSAGYADVITTVFGGRNARCAAEFVRQKGSKTWDQIEAEMLNGQKLQGTLTAREVFEVISSHEVDHLFPLFTVTYDIAFKGRDPADLVRVFETREVRPHKTAEECNILVLPPLMANARRRVR